MSPNGIRSTAAVLLASSLMLPPAVAPARGPHRGQSTDDEAATCAGVPPSPSFAIPREAVVSVSPLYQRLRSGRQLSGATLLVRAGPGAEADRLQRAFRCQIARCSVHPAPEGCPLAVQGIRVRVEPDGQQVRIQLWSDYTGAGPEIFARARLLGPDAGR